MEKTKDKVSCAYKEIYDNNDIYYFGSNSINS